MTDRKRVAAAIAARYDGGDFYIARPEVPGGDYILHNKSDDTAIAIIRHRRDNAVPRRWMARPVGAPDSARWTYSMSMMDAARVAYRNWRHTQCST